MAERDEPDVDTVDWGAVTKAGLEAGMTKPAIREYMQAHPDYGKLKAGGLSDAEIFSHYGLLDNAQQEDASKWGAGNAAANAVTLGAWRPLKASLESNETDPLTGELIGPNSDQYNTNMADSLRNKNAWDKEHPIGSAAIDIAGSTPATMAGLGAAGAMTRGALSTLPRVSRFIAGQGGDNILTRNLSTITHGAKTGLEAGVMQSGMHPDIPVEDQALAGTVVGGALSPIPQVANSIMTKGITPKSAQIARDAAGLGIDLTPGQLQFKPSAVKEGKATEQLRQVNHALFGTMGYGVDSQGNPVREFTKENFNAAANSISDEFKRVIPQIFIDPYNRNMHTALADLETDAASSIGVRPMRNAGYREFDNVLQSVRQNLQAAAQRPPMPGAQAGVMPGEQYEMLTKKGGPIDRLIQSQDTKTWGIRLRNILDDAADSANPQAKADLDTARNHWKNMLILENAAEKAQNTGGNINPAHLPNAVAKAYKDYAWTGTPDSNIGTIAEAGAFLKQRPTAQGDSAQPVTGNAILRAIKKVMPVLGGAAVGAEFGPEFIHSFTNPTATGLTLAAGAGLAYGGNRLAKSYAQTPFNRDNVINRILDPRSFQATPNSIIAPSVAAGEDYRNRNEQHLTLTRPGG